MNYKCLLSISLLLSAVPLVRAETECPESRQSQQMSAVMRGQEEIKSDLGDAKAALAFLLTRVVPTSNPLMGEVMSRAGKCCIKQMVVNNTPFGELSVDMPGVGPMDIMNADQAFEVAYSACSCLMDSSIAADRRNDALLDATLMTLAREELLSFVNAVLRTCNLGQCPVSDSVKSHCVTKSAFEEAKRYGLDIVVKEMYRKVKRS